MPRPSTPLLTTRARNFGTFTDKSRVIVPGLTRYKPILDTFYSIPSRVTGERAYIMSALGPATRELYSQAYPEFSGDPEALNKHMNLDFMTANYHGDLNIRVQLEDYNGHLNLIVYVSPKNEADSPLNLNYILAMWADDSSNDIDVLRIFLTFLETKAEANKNNRQNPVPALRM